MNYTSNLGEVVRTFFPPLSLSFPSAFFPSLSVYRAQTASKLGRLAVCIILIMTRCIQGDLCSGACYFVSALHGCEKKGRLWRNQRSKAASHRLCLGCLCRCPLSLPLSLYLSLFSLSSSHLFLLFPSHRPYLFMSSCIFLSNLCNEQWLQNEAAKH